MKNNYISYYELLTMVKEGNIPQLLILHLVPTKSVEYVPDYDYVSDKLVGYEILNDKDEDENYRYYLVDCFLESTMFDKVIEIIEEEKEIEKLKIEQDAPNNYHDIYNVNQPLLELENFEEVPEYISEIEDDNIRYVMQAFLVWISDNRTKINAILKYLKEE